MFMKIVGPFTELITMDKLPLRASLSDNELEIIKQGGIAFHNAKIIEIAKFEILKQKYPLAETELLTDEFVCLPGMIDAHTHICWAGNRANDYALRLAGKSYIEIAASGGGIWDTVCKTREATLNELISLTTQRANNLLQQGVTTIEVKSGYGLSFDNEIKILEAIKMANTHTPADLISTCLAAHIVPKEFDGNEEAYLSLIIEKLLPEIKTRNLTNRVDIFVEKGAFSISAAQKYLTKARKLGFDIVLHGNQFSSGGVMLANKVRALSIDHLETTNEAEISLLAKGDVIPIVLPAASLGLGEPFAPARRLLNAGTSLVIASDWNPGSAPMGNLLTSAALLGAAEKLSMTEVWAALTFRAANALNLTDRGILKTGMLADFIAFNTSDFKNILYRQGQLKPAKIWKSGNLILNSMAN